MFLHENSFLLIDEPTNHLDVQARESAAEYLSKKKGFILVSHDRAFLDKIIDHVISINRADIEILKGNFSIWEENRRLRDEYEVAENQKLKKDIVRLEQAAKRMKKWSDASEKKKIGFDPNNTEKSSSRRAYEGAKSKKAMARSKAFEERSDRAVEKKTSLLKNLEKTDKLKLSPLDFHSRLICEVKNASVFYDEKAVCENVSFEIKSGDAAAICGINGSGKSSIIKAIMGESITYTGMINLSSGVKISYIPQSADDLCGTLEDYADLYGIDYSLFLAVLRKLDFKRVQFEKRMEEYSAGQKKKMLIARSLCEKAHLYILDEPLNFIDVLSRIQIENLLLEFKPTLIFVEHDETFTRKIATKTVSLSK